MCRITWLFLCLLMGLKFSVSYAEDRRVLFRIDGEETSVEEFEHYYTQVYAASRVSVERFLPHFLYYKLKVADAKRQSWDTITDFRLQCSALQNEILKSEESKQECMIFLGWTAPKTRYSFKLGEISSDFIPFTPTCFFRTGTCSQTAYRFCLYGPEKWYTF